MVPTSQKSGHVRVTVALVPPIPSRLRPPYRLRCCAAALNDNAGNFIDVSELGLCSSLHLFLPSRPMAFSHDCRRNA